MRLQLRLYILLGIMLGILYAVIVLVSNLMGIGGFVTYAILAVVMVALQYFIGPTMVSWVMKVRNVSEAEEPELHQMVSELARETGIKKPRVCVSEVDLPNAFAYGRSQSDARVCVTRGIMRLLNRDELKAVIGHEMTHVKNRDMVFITLLSVLPMICYYIGYNLMWSGRLSAGGRKQGANLIPMVGAVMLLLYFITNLLVLYGSRIREYYADEGSVKLGNQPHYLATALYKLAQGNTKTSKEAARRVDGVKAFFVNDPSRALYEVRKLREIDTDMSGIIDANKLMALRGKTVRLGIGDNLMEFFGTHPNMLRRIKRLSLLT